MKKLGYKKYSSKVGSNNGFDGVYIKFDKHGNIADIVINESKFNTARLGKAYVGNKTLVKQMSNQWIDGNLEKMLNSSDIYVANTGIIIKKYIANGNEIKKTLNRVKPPTKIRRKYTVNK